MPEFIFYLMAIAACGFALMTVTSYHVFHSAVYLAMSLLSISAIYFYLEAQFLGVIQVLVYVGGIITLFIFTIKLTAEIGDRSIRQTNRQMFAAGLTAALLLGILLSVDGLNPWQRGEAPGQVIAVKDIGRALVTSYMLPFEFISVILLSAMIGAIVIGKEKK